LADCDHSHEAAPADLSFCEANAHGRFGEHRTRFVAPVPVQSESMKSIEADDKFPARSSESHDRCNALGGSSSASSIERSTLGPPVCAIRRIMTRTPSRVRNPLFRKIVQNVVACAQIVAPTQEKYGGRRRPNRERTILSADSFQINRPKTTQTLGVFRNHKFVVEPPVRIPLPPAESLFEPKVLRQSAGLSWWSTTLQTGATRRRENALA
jgi:hypothetical protein